MNINHIEKLRELVTENLNTNKRHGYVCIGYGSSNPSLSTYFNIDKDDLWALRSDCVFTKNWSGSDRSTIYYVTEEFYNKYIELNDMTPETKYLKQAEGYFDLMGIKRNSRVKVTHKVDSYANGWGSSWREEMDNFVGNEGYVEEITDGEVFICGWAFPFYVISPAPMPIKMPDSIRISPSYEVVFRADASIEVGCQIIPFDTLTAIYKAAKSVEDQIK